jgi:hypothetical protein
MAQHTFNYPLFQQQVPAMAASPSETLLGFYYAMAQTFANNGYDNYCGGFNGAALDMVLNLLTAHIAQIQQTILDGQDTVVVTGSSIDKVSVSLLAPPVSDSFQYWLQTTPYGKMVSALARAQFAGGFYVSKGLPERRGFRKVLGTFR